MFRNLKLVFLLAALPIFAACSALESDLIGQGVVTTVIEDSQSTQINSVTVFLIDGDVVIKGNVEAPKRYYSFSKISGHIDIDIISPGKPKRSLTNISMYPYRLLNKGARQTRFSAYYPEYLSKGTVIRFRLHKGKHTLM